MIKLFKIMAEHAVFTCIFTFIVLVCLHDIVLILIKAYQNGR